MSIKLFSFSWIRSALIPVSLSCISSLSIAQEKMEETVIYGSALHSISSIPTSQVSVIDSSDIQAMNPSSVLDLLRYVSGIHVTQQGGPGGISNVYIRGGESNFIAYMIDGVRVNTPTNTRGGSYDVSKIPLASIDRIEVIRGPQSSRFGSDAIAGVINIITKSSLNKKTVSASQSSDGQFESSVSLGGNLSDRISAVLGLSYADSDDVTPDSTHTAKTVHFKSTFAVNDQHGVNASVYFQDRERHAYPEDSGGPMFALSDELDYADQEDWAVGLRYNAMWSDAFKSEVYVNRYLHQSYFVSPGIVPFSIIPPNSNRDHYQRDNIGMSTHVDIVNSDVLSSGFSVSMEYIREDGESEGVVDFGVLLPTSFNLDRESHAFTLSNVFDVRDRISVNSSLRYDDFSNGDTQTSPQIGARLLLTSIDSAISINWGKGFKLPSFFALGHSLTGNPDLEPEESKSYDISFENSLLDGRIDNRITLFKNDFKNLVDFSSETFTNVNRDSVSTEGVELSVEYKASDALNSGVSITYLDVDADTGVTLRGRPDVTFGAFTQWQFTPSALLALYYQYTGEFIEASNHTSITTYEDLGRSDVVSMNLNWDVTQAMALSFSIDNALDQNYQQAVGVPSPGFSARAGINIDF